MIAYFGHHRVTSLANPPRRGSVLRARGHDAGRQDLDPHPHLAPVSFMCALDYFVATLVSGCSSPIFSAISRSPEVYV